MLVRIKTWEEMKAEFGQVDLNDGFDTIPIRSNLSFHNKMESLIPADRIIKVSNESDEDNDHMWNATSTEVYYICNEMISEVIL